MLACLDTLSDPERDGGSKDPEFAVRHGRAQVESPGFNSLDHALPRSWCSTGMSVVQFLTVTASLALLSVLLSSPAMTF